MECEMHCNRLLENKLITEENGCYSNKWTKFLIYHEEERRLFAADDANFWRQIFANSVVTEFIFGVIRHCYSQKHLLRKTVIYTVSYFQHSANQRLYRFTNVTSRFSFNKTSIFMCKCIGLQWKIGHDFFKALKNICGHCKVIIILIKILCNMIIVEYCPTSYLLWVSTIFFWQLFLDCNVGSG